MADTIVTDRDYVTNGQRVPAGKLSTQDLQDLMTVPVGPKGEKTRHITEDEAKQVQEDLLRRQAQYQKYTRGITERHEHTQDAGKIAMGGSE